VLGTGALAAGAGYAGLKWYRSYEIAKAREFGEERFAAGDYAAALEPLSRWVARNQTDLESLLKLAETRANVPQPDKRHLVDATRFYEAALVLDPKNQTALAALVRLYSELRMGNELGRAADALLALDSKNVAALEARILIAGSKGRYKDAVADTERLIAIAPDNYRWRATLLSLLQADGVPLPERAALVERWIAAGESDGRYRLFLAALAIEERDQAKAVDAASKAASLGLPDAATLGELLNLLDTLRIPAQIDVAIDASRAKGVDSAAIAGMQIERHWLAGRLELAEKELAQQIEAAGKAGQTPASADRRKALAFLRWQILLAELDRDPVRSDAAIAEAKALVASDEALKAETASWLEAIQVTRAVDIGGQLRPRAAIDQISLALDKDRPSEAASLELPGRAFLLLRAGDVAARSGEPDEAVGFYRQAFEREGRRWVLAGVRLSNALLAVGRTEEAFRLAYELVRSTESAQAYLVFAQACDALAREGRPPYTVDATLPRTLTASSLLEQFYTLSEKLPTLLPPLLSSLISEGAMDRAVGFARAAIEDKRTPADVLLLVAGLLGDRSAGDVAEAAIEAARARGADGGDVALARTRMFLVRNDAAAARGLATDALGAATGRIRLDLLRLRAQAAIAANDADAVAMLSEYLRAGESDIETVLFVLDQPISWTDRTLVNAAFARLEELSGPRSARTVLTNAARVLRFDRNKPEDVAKAARAVDQDVLQRNPESIAARVTLARLLAALQPPDFAQAAKYMQEAINLQPGRRDLYPELVSLLQASGDFATAGRYLQMFMRDASDVQDRRLAVGLMLEGGEYAAAVPALESIAKQSGTESDLVALADALRRAGRSAEAEATYKQALERPDRSAISAMAYAEFLARSGRLDEARAAIAADAAREKPALTPANRAYLAALLELDYGDPKNAGPAIAEALRLAPESPGVALLAAREKVALGDLAGGLAIARSALEKAPENEQLLTFVASLVMADASTRSGAGATLSALEARNPALAKMLAIVGASAGPNGELAPGPDQLRAMLALVEEYPSFAPAWTVAAEMHEAVGKIDDAIRIADRARIRLPSEPGPAALAARLHLVSRRFADARDAARSWRALTADSPLDADAILARIALVDGKPADAIAILDPYRARLDAEAARRPEALGTLVVAEMLEGRADAAIALASKHLAIPAFRGEFLAGTRVAPTETAFAVLAGIEPILAVDDGGRLALVSEYAALALRKDATARAVAAADALLAKVAPEVRSAPIASLLAADLAAARGDLTTAVEGYERVWNDLPQAMRESLVRFPSLDAKAREELAGPLSVALYASNNLAATTATASAAGNTAADLDRALAAIERALAMQPGDPALLDTKATVLLARREAEPARALLVPLVDARTATIGVRLTLVRIEIAAGRLEEARKHLLAAQQLLREDPLIDRVTQMRTAELEAELKTLEGRRRAAG
jgi:predicted Zn-dependent protease